MSAVIQIQSDEILPWNFCQLCLESFEEVKRSKTFFQLCQGCHINHNNKVSRQNKRVKKLGIEGRLYLMHWIFCLHRHNYSCVDCNIHGSKERLTLDHIKRLCDGGKHTPDNIAPRCLDCHQQKDNVETQMVR